MVRWSWSKIVISVVLSAIFAALAVFVIGAWDLHKNIRRGQIASFESVKSRYQESDAILLDRDGEAIDSIRTDFSGRRLQWTSFEDISPVTVNAIMKIEDRRFFSHHGVDWRALAGAFFQNIMSGHVRGASTITMQLISVLDEKLKPARGKRRALIQKWEQIKAATALEGRWSKRQILETYVNLISYRGELQGIAAASRGLFDKEPAGLDKAESYLMGALITSPNGSVKATARRACHFGKSEGPSFSCDYVEALAGTVLARPYRIRPETGYAPHVVRMLLADGGDRVVSTLDGRLQRFVFEALNDYVRTLRERNVSDGAAIAVENRTGEVLAYVGNSGTSPETIHVDGARARRQAGSTLKPFLYELALEEKLLTAASILDDAPLHVTTATGLYVPLDYDQVFRGPVSVRTALSSSLNIPAVRTLLLVGVTPFVESLRGIGFKGLKEDPDFYGYSIALGSADVTLTELVNAYRTLANRGEWSEMRLRLDKKAGSTKRIMDPGAVFVVSDMLSDREARSVTFGLENPLSTRFWTAVKTGTSKDMRDNWCIGYSDTYTVGVWVGNFSGEPMRNVTGITGAAPVWLEIMNYLHREKTSRAPKAPQGVVLSPVTFAKKIEPDRNEWFMTGTEPFDMVKKDTLHAKPRIVYPAEETYIVLDPEIPDDLQRVPFRFQPAAQKYEWVINDEQTGTSDSLFLWKPKRGRYIVTIVDKDNRIVDSVRFTVR
jgi:penicillin-binding protein 1C